MMSTDKPDKISAVRIERGANGFIVWVHTSEHTVDARPHVFNAFEDLVQWLAENLEGVELAQAPVGLEKKIDASLETTHSARLEEALKTAKDAAEAAVTSRPCPTCGSKNYDKNL